MMGLGCIMYVSVAYNAGNCAAEENCKFFRANHNSIGGLEVHNFLRANHSSIGRQEVHEFLIESPDPHELKVRD